MISPNVIIPLASNSIPSGFVEETTLNGKFALGAGSVGLNTTGGSATHLHTYSGSHAHTNQPHAHTFTLGYAYDNQASNTGIYGVILALHEHSASTSGAVASFSCNSVTPSCTTVNHEPKHVVLKYIRSTKYNFLPVNGIEMRVDSNPNLQECNGSGGSVNLQNSFMKGGTFGSSSSTTSHGHTVAHTHSISHAHSQAMSGSSSYGYILRNNYGVEHPTFPAKVDHLHITYFDTHTNGSVSHSTSSSSTTQEPPYYTLKAYQNVSGSVILPKVGMIGLLLGDTIPVGWSLCDGSNGTPDLRNVFIKITSSAGSTGGSSTHTHNSISHNHSYSHSHTGSTSGMDRNGIESMRNQSWEGYILNHTHPVSVSNATMTTNNADIVFNPATTMPEYRAVNYIQMQFSCIGGSFLFNLL